MEKKSKTRIIVIDHLPFVIDTVKCELRQWNDPGNRIAFDELKDEGKYFSMLYSKDSKNVADQMQEASLQSTGSMNIIIPSVLLKEHELKDDIQNAINENSRELNWGIFIGDEAIANRLSGVLPHIDLAGTDHIIDWRSKELRASDAPYGRISLKGMAMSDTGEEYLCFFNTKSRTVYEPEENMTALPKDVVLLVIPGELKLDPVAVAREYGMKDTDLLFTHPIQQDLAANIKPLSETGLPAMIEKNLKAQRP